MNYVDCMNEDDKAISTSSGVPRLGCNHSIADGEILESEELFLAMISFSCYEVQFDEHFSLSLQLKH